MKLRVLTIVLLATGLLGAGQAMAQQPAAAPNPLDVIPDKMPFAEPYGAPISMQQAQVGDRRRPSRRPTSGAGR